MIGPRSRALLQQVTSADLSNEAFPFRTAREIDIGFARVLCVRITYVGELGYELYIPAEQATHVYERLLAVNYLGAVHMTAAALPHLKRTRGLIVAIASIAGLTGVPERTGYAASKHALVGFFESLRIELADSGVDVTIVAPDFVVSQIHRRASGADGRPLGQTPMQEGRIMSAARCAQLTAGAMRRRQRLLITSARGRLGRWARLVAPRLVDGAALRAIRERR